MNQKDNDWKSRLGMVYSTNPDFAFETDEEEENETLPPSQQKLRIGIERKNRGGNCRTSSGYPENGRKENQIYQERKRQLL